MLPAPGNDTKKSQASQQHGVSFGFGNRGEVIDCELHITGLERQIAPIYVQIVCIKAQYRRTKIEGSVSSK